jgi:hypothetical protein
MNIVFLWFHTHARACACTHTTHKCARIHPQTNSHTNTFTHTNARTHTHTHPLTQSHTHSRTQSPPHTYTNTHPHTHTTTHTHTHTHTHIHARARTHWGLSGTTRCRNVYRPANTKPIASAQVSANRHEGSLFVNKGMLYGIEEVAECLLTLRHGTCSYSWHTAKV